MARMMRAFKIRAAAGKVENIAAIGIEEQRVDCEVAAKRVLFGIGFKVDGRGMAAIGVIYIAAEGSDFHTGFVVMDQHNTEVRAHLSGLRKEPQQIGGRRGRGDVEIFRDTAQQ